MAELLGGGRHASASSPPTVGPLVLTCVAFHQPIPHLSTWSLGEVHGRLLSVPTILTGLTQSIRALGALRSEKEAEAVRADLLRKVTHVQGALLALQDQHMALQEQHVALQKERATLHSMHLEAQKRVVDLEAETRHLRHWQVEREKYELTELGTNAVAYTLQEEYRDPDEPGYNLCAHCFEDAQRSILQRTAYDGFADVLTCNRCKATVTYVDPNSKPIDPYAV